MEESGELSLMHAVVIDLLMVESGGADKLVRPELRKERWSQARISGQLPVLRQPLGERSGADADAEPFLDMDSNALTRIAAIVAHEGLKDDGQRIGFAFLAICGVKTRWQSWQRQSWMVSSFL